jgi:hypothetical protein
MEKDSTERRIMYALEDIAATLKKMETAQNTNNQNMFSFLKGFVDGLNKDNVQPLYKAVDEFFN